VDTRPIGRDAEFTTSCAYLSATSGAPTSLGITGDAGIGKTVLWRHLVQTLSRSARVLSCRPAPAERPLAFSALDDLFAGVAEEVLPGLEKARRKAVEDALLRGTPIGTTQEAPFEALHPPPERHVLARGILDALRILSEEGPLVLAVDDAQWLDHPSAAALEFCFRRLEREPLSILLTFRADDPVPLGLSQALPPDHLKVVRLGPLSLGAIGEILRSRLGTALPRYTLTRLYDGSGGNPFYAIQCARLLLEHPPMPRTNEPIPIPDTLKDLVRHRLHRLPARVRRVGWLVAASSNPQERLIRAAYSDRESWAAIDQAIDVGLLERDGELLRFTHPLLRSVQYTEMRMKQRRLAHRQLAATAIDIEERAWHLALGADRPSEKTAEILATAADHAASRGVPEAAAALEEQAIRLTPASRSGRTDEWTVRAADHYFRAGDITRSRKLIETVLDGCPAGPLRGRLLVRLATIHYHQSGWPIAEQIFLEAAQDAADDPALRAHAEQELAFARLVAGDLTDASRWANASLRSAEQAADPRLVAHSLARIALFDFLQGHGARFDLLAKAEALEEPASQEPVGRLPMLGPSLVAAMVFKWCDQLDEARRKLADQYRRALNRGDEASLPFLLYHFSQLECWAGNWDAAAEYALEGCRVADESSQRPMRPATLYSLALVRAHQGQVQQSEGLVAEALALCEQTQNVPLTSQLVAVLGFLALSLDDHQTAHSHLGRLAQATTAVGLREPSVVKFLPDEIEALTALGEIDQARLFTLELEARGKSLGRPWAQAAAARCRAHLAAATGDSPQAQSACQEALSRHARLPMPFELGRTLLIKGMIERRNKRKSAAREALGQALGIFEHLGAPLWAAKAQRELSKISTRSLADGLTETERRIADLIAHGHTNREIASAMFITQNTVQTHVQHIFQKVGVRSRTELTARFLSAPSAARSKRDRREQ
jgi:DNA-binding CsgD family transcriptional regulator